MNPVIAVLVGAWLGGEHVTKRMLVGAAVVLLSVVLVLRRRPGEAETVGDGEEARRDGR